MKGNRNGLLRKSLLVLILLMFILLFSTSCGGGSNAPQGSGGTAQQVQGGGSGSRGSELDGTWVWNGPIGMNMVEPPTSIYVNATMEFSGNQFTWVFEQFMATEGGLLSQTGVHMGGFLNLMRSDSAWDNRVFVRNYYNSDNSVQRGVIYAVTESGTFSLADDGRVEVIRSDGSILVISYARTANTLDITLGGSWGQPDGWFARFTRQ